MHRLDRLEERLRRHATGTRRAMRGGVIAQKIEPAPSLKRSGGRETSRAAARTAIVSCGRYLASESTFGAQLFHRRDEWLWAARYVSEFPDFSPT